MIGLPRLDEPVERVGEVVADLVGEDPARGDVVAVAEAAGNGQELVVVHKRRAFEDFVDVAILDGGAGELEGVGGFLVAVRAGGPQDQRRGLHVLIISAADGGAKSAWRGVTRAASSSKMAYSSESRHAPRWMRWSRRCPS